VRERVDQRNAWSNVHRWVSSFRVCQRSPIVV
jgi:hypothetical protein